MSFNISTIWGKFKATSPFGSMKRMMEDTGLGGKVVKSGPGKTVPDLIREWFSTNDISQIRNPSLAFADRDKKERVYDPGNDDPFVFRDNKGPEEFKRACIDIIDLLVAEWKELGLPVKHDKDRKVDVPDSEPLLTEEGYAKYKEVVDKNIETIMMITSNIDIAMKFNLVRTVTLGWWIQSYSGQDNANIAEFRDAFEIFGRIVNKLRDTPEFAKQLKQLEDEAGDPLTTNAGYPYFSAEMDKLGRPVTKVKTINLFAGISRHLSSVATMNAFVSEKCKNMALGAVPFACACIRRMSYGWKFSHTFKVTSFGLQSVEDERGFNTVRVAWMVPYTLNLIISPLQRLWKAYRKMIPGMYREGKAINLENQFIAKHPKSMMFIAEADYSNYDRTIARNMILKLNEYIIANSPRKKFWMEIVNHIHTSIPLLWPDYVTSTNGVVWAFRAKIIGLLSGLKITSEEGTLFNLLINIKAMLIEGWTADVIVKYFSSYQNGIVSMDLVLRIQSDDTLIKRNSFPELIRACQAFKQAATLAGVKSTVAVGDRYLMRHMFEGKDAPVLCRIFQNTISNEEPVTDPLKFAVGMAMRTDGLLGHKTIVANSARTGYSITVVELKLTILVMEKLYHFLTTAKSPVSDAILVCSLILEEAKSMLNTRRYTASTTFKTKIDRVRFEVVRKLAAAELLKSNDATSQETFIAMLLRDSSKPSSKMMLDQLVAASPELRALMNKYIEREHAFYVYAMGKLGLKLDDY